jgi:ADP-ribose pyrophosphatase
MVDGGEDVSKTLKREFSEETLNSMEHLNGEEKVKLKADLKILFAVGTILYKGYVDDPRNTDNAWMETVAVNFHDKTGETVGRLPLHAGDDANSVDWKDIDSSFRDSKGLNFYASHPLMLKQVAELHGAHW